MNTPGPDVLTSCGNLGRLLTLGVEYVIGIGGPCSPIPHWSTLASFSDNEVTLLESLRDSGAENPSSCSATMGIDPTLATSAVTTSDTDPVTMDTDPTIATVMTTSDTDPVTKDMDPTRATTSDTEPLARVTDST